MSAFPVPLIQFLSGSLVAGVLFTSGYIGLLNDARSLGVNISELPEKSFQVIVFNGFWTIFAVLICISLIFSLYYLIHRATNRRLHQMVLSKWNKNDSDEKLIFKVLSLTILCCSIGLSSKAKFGNIVDKLLVLDKVDFVESAKTQINLDHQYLFVTINDYWIVLYDTNSKVTIRYPKSSIKSFSTKEPSVN